MTRVVVVCNKSAWMYVFVRVSVVCGVFFMRHEACGEKTMWGYTEH